MIIAPASAGACAHMLLLPTDAMARCSLDGLRQSSVPHGSPSFGNDAGEWG